MKVDPASGNWLPQPTRAEVAQALAASPALAHQAREAAAAAVGRTDAAATARVATVDVPGVDIYI